MQTFDTRNDIKPPTRKAVIAILQARLFDAVDIFTQVKHAHWNVKGRHFLTLHELFDDIAEIVEEHGDLIAERITSLGGRADGTARVVSTNSSLAEYPLDITTGKQHVAALADRIAQFGNAVRPDIDRVAGLGDTGTSDLLTEVSRAIDKQLWLLEAHEQAEG